MMSNLTQLFTCTLGRFLQRKLDNTMTFKIKFLSYGHQGGKAGLGGGGGMNWEIGIDMYTLICIK